MSLSNNFIKENHINIFINPNVKPVIIRNNNGTNSIYYTWNNCLFKYKLESGCITLKKKILVNSIVDIKLPKHNNNLLYFLSTNTNNHNAQLLEYDVINDKSLRLYDFEYLFSKESKNNNNTLCFEISFNEKHAIIQTIKSLVVFNLKSFIIEKEIFFSDLIKNTYEITKIKKFTLFPLKKELFVSIIINDSILILNVNDESDFVFIDEKNLKSLKTINSMLLEDEEIESGLKIIASDIFGKIYILENIISISCIVDSNNQNLSHKNYKFKVNKNQYILTSHHWHSSSIVLTNNEHNIFSIGNDGVLMSLSMSTLNKSFFPRIVDLKPKQITCNDSAIILVTDDQLKVYNYLENKTINSINFLNYDLSKYSKTNNIAKLNNNYVLLKDNIINFKDDNSLNPNNLDSENINSKKYICFFNKVTGVAYFANPNYNENNQIIKLELKLGNYINNKHSFENNINYINKNNNYKSYLSFSNITISSLSIYDINNNYTIISTIEELYYGINYKVVYLKFWKITKNQELNNYLRAELISIAINPFETYTCIKEFNIYKLSLNNYILASMYTSSLNNDLIVKIWKNKYKLGFISDCTLNLKQKNNFNNNNNNNNSCISIYLKKNLEVNNFYIPYLILFYCNEIVKINLDNYQLENRNFINQFCDKNELNNFSQKIMLKISQKNKYGLLYSNKILLCFNTEDLSFLWKKNYFEEKLELLDLNINCLNNNMFNILLRDTEEKLKYLYLSFSCNKKINLLEAKVFLIKNCYYIELINNINYNQDNLMVIKRLFKDNNSISLFNINNTKKSIINYSNNINNKSKILKDLINNKTTDIIRLSKKNFDGDSSCLYNNNQDIELSDIIENKLSIIKIDKKRLC